MTNQPGKRCAPWATTHARSRNVRRLPNSTLDGGRYRAEIQVTPHEVRARMTPAAIASGETSHPTEAARRPSRNPAMLRSYHGVLTRTAGSAFGARREIGPRNTPR